MVNQNLRAAVVLTLFFILLLILPYIQPLSHLPAVMPSQLLTADLKENEKTLSATN